MEKKIMADAGFRKISDGLSQTPDGLEAHIPQDWRQGRTAYGGVSAALALEAVFKTYQDLPPLRSALINFIGPVPENPVYKSQILRQGRNVTTIEVKGYDGEVPVVSVMFSFGASRVSELSVGFSAPKAPAPETCEPYTPDRLKNFVPIFFQQFETRLIEGGRPVTAQQEGYVRVWTRHQHAGSRDGTASLFCIADVLPPGALPMLKTPGPVSSMTWIFNILSEKPSTEGGWWQIETRLTAAYGGYSTQVMRIWNTAGDLIAEGMQSVAIFV